MSVCETLRNPLPSKPYTLPAGDRDGKVTGFNPLNPNGDPTLIPSSPSSRSASILSPTTRANRLVSPLNFPDGKTGAPKNTQTRMRPVPKPERTVVQNPEGKFICTWHNCSSPIKEFRRKCEWSKHMDKHERPYKCRVAGCENILGFTYAGGLLRHEREVHHKHGGPKNPLYCPHKACKRSTSNCFARLENLNEHLRRCHTPSEANVYSEEPDSTNGMQPLSDAVSPLPISPPPAIIMTGPRIGRKRKAEDSNPREEVKRLRSENQELKRKIEAGYHHQRAMMGQIDKLETILRRRLIDVELLNQSNSIL
ncbi:hypothetical protein GGS24DRAFT_57470 [Hypoxylon argillaceum]|nr:hypothetical protein GGS24DRAFT_57470 [Hypoxylon argillaceum]